MYRLVTRAGRVYIERDGVVVASGTSQRDVMSGFLSLIAASDGIGLGRAFRVDGLVPLGELTTDGRRIASGTWAEFPLPFSLLSDGPHGMVAEAPIVGVIEEGGETDGVVWCAGHYLDTEEGVDAAGYVETGAIRHASVETSGGTVVEECIEEDDDGWCIASEVTYSDVLFRGVAQVPIPAYATAVVSLTDSDDTEGEGEDSGAEDAASSEVAASATDCAGACGCGGSCGAETGAEAVASRADASAPLHSVTAAAPPVSVFADPALDGPTPLTVTEDGRVFGHAALWGTCHTGRPDTCLTPPRSATAYAYFRTGAVLCDDGTSVPVGQITMSTGHAGLDLGANATVAHYDHTGTAVADVAAGEDRFGIWLAGRVRPGVTPEQIEALRAGAVSGDWRRVGSSLELVAMLAVNVPGYPVPRSMAASGAPMSLVAAGGAPLARTIAEPWRAAFAALSAEVAALRTIAEPMRPLAASAYVDAITR